MITEISVADWLTEGNRNAGAAMTKITNKARAIAPGSRASTVWSIHHMLPGMGGEITATERPLRTSIQMRQ